MLNIRKMQSTCFALTCECLAQNRQHHEGHARAFTQWFRTLNNMMCEFDVGGKWVAYVFACYEKIAITQLGYVIKPSTTCTNATPAGEVNFHSNYNLFSTQPSISEQNTQMCREYVIKHQSGVNCVLISWFHP